MDTSGEIIDKNQDRNQRMKVISQFGIEFYKILTGCLLLLFVPQDCDGTICSMDQIISYDGIFYKTTLYFNAVTFLSFLLLYAAELKREHGLIELLEVNVNKARDNNSVGLELMRLNDKKRMMLKQNRQNYNNSGKMASLLFLVNTLLSAINLYQYQTGSKTVTVFMTNVMFTATKLGNIFSIVGADENVFYSSYMVRKVQFNDVDPNALEDNNDLSNDDKSVDEKGKEVSSENNMV